MAANLVKAGNDVRVFNRTSGRAGPLLDSARAEAGNVAEGVTLRL